MAILLLASRCTANKQKATGIIVRQMRTRARLLTSRLQSSSFLSPALRPKREQARVVVVLQAGVLREGRGVEDVHITI